MGPACRVGVEVSIAESFEDGDYLLSIGELNSTR